MIKFWPVDIDTIDPEAIFDIGESSADRFLENSDITGIILEYPRESTSVERDESYYVAMGWCTDVIGPKGERWTSGGYGDDTQDIFLFEDKDDAVAFKMRWHGALT